MSFALIGVGAKVRQRFKINPQFPSTITLAQPGAWFGREAEPWTSTNANALTADKVRTTPNAPSITGSTFS